MARAVGHAIERIQGYGDGLHGEAVAAGMVLASRLSVHRGALDSQVVDQLKAFKLKRNAVENELVNEQRIGLDGLRALCIAYGVSIVYVVGRTYYDFQHGDERGAMHREGA